MQIAYQSVYDIVPQFVRPLLIFVHFHPETWNTHGIEIFAHFIVKLWIISTYIV